MHRDYYYILVFLLMYCPVGLRTKPPGGGNIPFFTEPSPRGGVFDTVIYRYLPYHVYIHMPDARHLQNFAASSSSYSLHKFLSPEVRFIKKSLQRYVFDCK